VWGWGWGWGWSVELASVGGVEGGGGGVRDRVGVEW